ncbi:MAG: hypothetical protein Q7T18_01045 [Sedimentisphaerales bacterium]|nr:hypothetical protein [Sedimentisphaerales bacterium]
MENLQEKEAMKNKSLKVKTNETTQTSPQPLFRKRFIFVSMILLLSAAAFQLVYHPFQKSDSKLPPTSEANALPVTTTVGSIPANSVGPISGKPMADSKLPPTSQANALPVTTTVGSTPINSVDPISGKPTKNGSPTTIYKGYVIGFCCETSRSSGGWEKKNEAEKDAFLRRFIKKAL